MVEPFPTLKIHMGSDERQQQRQSKTVEASFDPLFVGAALNHRGFQAIHEPGLGHGYAMVIGHDDTEARVGIFPQVNAVQVVSGSSILRIEKVMRVRQRDDQLLFEAVENEERVTLELSPTGRFALIRTPLLGETGEALAAPDPAPRPSAPDSPPSPTPTKRQTESIRPARQSAPADTEEQTTHTAHTENDRLTIRGRVGGEVRFRQSGRRGMLIGTFPLGEHPDLETTLWHAIVVFGDRAAKLKEKGLSKGQEIEVVGYIHERQVKSTGEGQESKTVRELYATAIRTTLRKPSE